MPDHTDTYGYRYKTGGHVFPLDGLGYPAAVDAVHERRLHQARNATEPTAELVEQTPNGWRPVPLPDNHAQEVTTDA